VGLRATASDFCGFKRAESSLYGLSEGKQFTVQYNPVHPSLYYCNEAHTRSLTIKLSLAIVGFLFAVAEFLIE